jgi:hypothetical protein
MRARRLRRHSPRVGYSAMRAGAVLTGIGADSRVARDGLAAGSLLISWNVLE